jgi:hypothetical protein
MRERSERMKVSSALLALVAIGSLGISRNAHALGPVDVEVAGKVGGASNVLSGSNPNPLGFGLGGRAGVSIFGFYGGLAGMYYFGSSQNGAGALGLPDLNVSVHAVQYGFEGGVNIGLLNKLLTVRPQLGIGNLTVTASALGQSQDSSSVYVEPGVTGLVTFGLLLVGADVNVLFAPSLTQSNAAVTAHAQIGVKF